MQKIIYKVFFDYQKEEVWINDMAMKGYSLIAYSPLRYVFKKTEKAKYQFKIELLEKMPNTPESQDYLEFLEENGIEFVASSLRWIFLRKENDGNGFELINDVRTKLLHYKRYLQMVIPLWIINMLAFLLNLVVFMFNNQQLNMFTFMLNFSISILLGISIIKYWVLYSKTKKEALIYE